MSRPRNARQAHTDAEAAVRRAFPGTATEGIRPPTEPTGAPPMSTRPLTPHPAADAFPMADEATLGALATDVAAHGLRSPILVHDDGERRWLVDGRNRLEACRRAGVQPTHCA